MLHRLPSGYKEPYIRPARSNKARDSRILLHSRYRIPKPSEQKRFLQRAVRLFGCLDCRERSVSCLSFYFYRGSRLKAIRIRDCKTIEDVKQELSGGIVLCANCQKERTAPLRPNPSVIRKYKSTHGCLVCLKTNPDILELHHKRPEYKHFNLSEKRCSVPTRVFNTELNKVIVLCANCHTKEHSL